MRTAKRRRKMVLGEQQRMMQVLADIFDKTRQILARRDRADRAGENVVKQQRRDGEFRQRAPHGFLDHAIHAAPHEHGARFDVKRPHSIAEQHDGENEPGGALANHFLGIAAGVIGRGGQIGKNDRGGAPEGDERQHHRGGDEHLDRGPFGDFRRRHCAGKTVRN